MKKIGLLACSLCFSSLAFAKSLPTEPVLKTELAKQIAETAYKNCVKESATPSVSIVDRQGTLLYFQRGEGIGPHSVKTSFRKAHTAASLRMPTAALSAIADLPKYSQLGKMTDDILLLTGGLPIYYNGTVIGGIGMSGVPNPELEEKCAADALASHFE